MKVKLTIPGLLVAVILTASCSKKERSVVDGVNEIWVLERYETDRIVYKSAAALEPDKAGYIFYSNGQLAERKAAGWCATPPVSYENYDGQWQLSSSIYDIVSGYWGGTQNYRLEVISRNGNEIVTKRL